MDDTFLSHEVLHWRKGRAVCRKVVKRSALNVHGRGCKNGMHSKDITKEEAEHLDMNMT